MATSELGGYNASITKRDWQRDPLNAERIVDDFVDQFSDDDVRDETIKSILFRDSRDRQTLMNYRKEEMLEMLVSKEDKSDRPDLISALKCLGYFPEQEKRFLIDILRSERKDEKKFAFLEEAIFSSTKEHLEYYRGDHNVEQQKQNEKIVSAITMFSEDHRDEHIRTAVENILSSDCGSENPFSKEAEYYSIAGAGSRSLKATYEICTSGNRALRILQLKRMVLAAAKDGNGLLLVKFICSHCSLDLKSITSSVSKEDLSEEELAEIGNYAGLGELMSKELTEKDLIEPIGIKGDYLKKLLLMAAFGPQ